MPEERFRSFLARAPMPVAVLDCHLRFLDANSWMEQIVGIPGGLHGRSLQELLPDGALDPESPLRQALASGQSPQIEIARRPPGSQNALNYWILSFVPLSDGEIALVASDITESKNAAQRDPLTDLYNRRYLEDSTRRELSRAARGKLPLSVMMIDIDHFKEFNDREGHATGDLLLQSVGRLICSRVRAEDITCRYGGDEFSIIFSNMSSKHLVIRAGQLQRAIRQITIKSRDKVLTGITASFGLAVFPDHGITVPDLMKAADDALYEAKSGGRDRVKLAEPRPPSGKHQVLKTRRTG
jgi:diguanylate cyclase (GGDEF)-like protein